VTRQEFEERLLSSVPPEWAGPLVVMSVSAERIVYNVC
jgi:hypothetical protein